MHDLIRMTSRVVRLLPMRGGMKSNQTASRYIWTPPRDFREICACQRHARQERALWRRALRVARKRGVALLVTVPLAFGAIGIEAMNVSLPALAKQAMTFGQQQSFPILTRNVREAFLHPERAKATLSLDVAKEEFFRTEVPFGSIIYNEAMKNGLPPELVAAMVESESDFQPRLVSNKNAKGLMQIVPETGRLMGCDDLFNPHANVAAGTKYFRYLLNRFGDEKIALAAYNAGEGAVERFGGVPEYRETIDYVQRVASRTGSYRKRVQQRYNVAVAMQESVVAR
jgi:soluble lytic murein transglycosylase-like protein